MRQSQLFAKTRREAPKDEVSKNAILLTRAGFVSKEMAGVYNFLPLGLKTLNKIIEIIREEMNALGAQEIFMSSLQRKELWERTDRWSDEKVDAWFKTQLKDGAELGLGFTHEEPISNMLEQFVSSYKDLPFSLYQFQTKFRNETRAKSGIMRTREFIMKDLYSFSRDEAEHQSFYDRAADAYSKIFERVGIGEKTYMTRASGGSFSRFSHEFQTVTDTGEDTIYTIPDSKMAINKEIINEPEALSDLSVKADELIEKRAVEVGNIFTLGTKFSEYLNFKNEKGEEQEVFMGSYGIGPARLMGTIVELLSDEKGIVWPESVAPFKLHLLLLSPDEKVRKLADEIYHTLSKENIETLFDDRDLRAGEKFNDADLIGIPHQLIIGDKVAQSGMFELKNRQTGEIRQITLEHVLSEFK